MNRLDIELVKRKIVLTRSKAQQTIKEGIVWVNNKPILKSSFIVSNEDIVEIKGRILPYVSRGGLKLEKALKEFNIDLNNKILLDIGSSTGGFVDCALQNNAKKVIALDVGTNQLVDSLKNNKKVLVFEQTDFRYFENDILNKIDFITIDVSFISVVLLIKKINQLNNVKEIICLIKPEFECTKEEAKRYKGIILNQKIHLEVINKIINNFNHIEFYLKDIIVSPIKGGDGNIEYLAYFTKEEKNKQFDMKVFIKEAFAKKV